MRFKLYNLYGCYVIDAHGYRANVGIILTNLEGQVFWCRRVGQDAWQFPQGGIKMHESIEQAMFRELKEEVALSPEHVGIIAVTRRWLHYRLPPGLVRRDTEPVCIGQKQRWFMLRLLADESHIGLDQSPKPEFDQWRWVNYGYPVKHIVEFKRRVYRKALTELKPFLRAAKIQGAAQRN